jgi:hypothetical protein
LLQAAEIGRELVIGNHGRDGGHEADGRCEQGLGNAGCHNGEARILACRDGGERVHDSPHRAEQSNKGCGRARGGQEGQSGLKLAHIDGERSSHSPLDTFPPLRATLGNVLIAPGLIASRDDPARGTRHLRMKPVTRTGCRFESAGLTTDVSEAQNLLEDDRPAAERCQNEQDHDALDDRIGLQKQAKE